MTRRDVSIVRAVTIKLLAANVELWDKQEKEHWDMQDVPVTIELVPGSEGWNIVNVQVESHG